MNESVVSHQAGAAGWNEDYRDSQDNRTTLGNDRTANVIDEKEFKAHPNATCRVSNEVD